LRSLLPVAVIGEPAGALDDRGDALEAHAGVHVLRGQRGEGAVGVGVVLDEDVVPDLDAAGVGAVDQRGPLGLLLGRGLPRAGAQVDVDLGARTAGAGLAHHPEVVLLAAVDDVHLRVEAHRAELRRPQLPGLLVALGRVLLGRIGLVDGRVDALRRELPDLDHQLPGPVDGVLLEVVAEGPVAQHLEEGVVVGVQAHVIEVVVLAAGADALLGVGRAGVERRDGSGPLGDVGLALAEEDRDELVHAGIGEQQVGAVRHEAGAGYDRVLLGPEEIQERLADLGGRHGWRFRRWVPPRKQVAQGRDRAENRKNPVGGAEGARGTGGTADIPPGIRSPSETVGLARIGRARPNRAP